MASTLPTANSCCDPCDPTSPLAVPGPAGAAGASGTNGTNGANAYTVTTASFIMPAEGANVTIAVSSSAWATLSQIVAVSVGGAFGEFSVISKPTATSLEIQNLENTASSLYTANSPPTTVFASGATVSPAGRQGPQGAATAGALLAANNLSDLVSPSTARTNLGLGTAATRNIGVTNTLVAIIDTTFTLGDMVFATASGVQTQTAGATRTFLGLVVGTDVQAFDATLSALASANWAANALPIGTGSDTLSQTAFAANTFPARASTGNLVAKAITDFALTLLDDADAATMRATLGIPTGSSAMLLYRQEELTSVDGGDFNATGTFDQVVPLNTEVVDTGSHGSITGNTITLAAGTYRYRYGVLGFAVNFHQGVLHDLDAPGNIANSYGTVGDGSGAASNSWSFGSGRFTLAVSHQIQLRARCSITNPADGFGTAANFSVGEIYSWLELEKEA